MVTNFIIVLSPTGALQIPLVVQCEQKKQLIEFIHVNYLGIMDSKSIKISNLLYTVDISLKGSLGLKGNYHNIKAVTIK